MLPVTHAVIDEDGDVLSTHALYSEVPSEADAAFRVVALYDLSCFDLLETLMWNNHKQVWEARARGSNVFHRSRLLREAVGLAVASVVKPVAEEDALW